MHHPKKILFAPLDWGLGHTTRCIPLIKECLAMGHEVYVAGNVVTNKLIHKEFPNIEYLELKGYNIVYTSQKWKLPFSILYQIPKIISVIKYENQYLNRIIDSFKIEIIFADNRYGLYSTKIPCYFITHQLQIQIPQSGMLQKIVNKINHFYINKFTTCLVPDYKGENMSGILSQNNCLKQVEYLGNLSRFSPTVSAQNKYDIMLLLSGPEPQRSILENLFLNEIRNTTYKAILVRGNPSSNILPQNDSLITIVNHLSSHELQMAILQSNIIICRSGYSTIMDLIKLKKRAIIIPTPGQTEQEYLGDYLMNKKWFITCNQSNFDLDKLIETYKAFSFNEFPTFDLMLYKSKLNELLA